jgi:hypothetical protein
VVEALNAASDRVLSELLPLLLAQAERDMQQRGLTPSPSEEKTGSL